MPDGARRQTTVISATCHDKGLSKRDWGVENWAVRQLGRRHRLVLLVCLADARGELIEVFEHALQYSVGVHCRAAAGETALMQQLRLQQHR